MSCEAYVERFTVKMDFEFLKLGRCFCNVPILRLSKNGSSSHMSLSSCSIISSEG